MTGPRALHRPSLEAAGIVSPPPPVRIVHLGLGAFHRAHQAWYTAQVDRAGEWGIAAFTGRDPAQSQLLGAQDGLYTLVVRGPERDDVELVTSIVEARPGSDVPRLVELLADATVAVVTMTITEAGYRLAADRRVDLRDPVIAADLERLRRASAAHADLGIAAASPDSSLCRLLVGLAARARSGGAPLAVVPCDNLPENGRVVSDAIVELAAQVPDAVGPGFVDWLTDRVSFVSTSVDRITPRANDDAVAAARAAGWDDHAPVVTEPFHGWVLAGGFPAGRPAWELAGARFVDDIEPWERRKLWLLNGAHTILAVAGLRRGHETVSQAVADADCLDLVAAFWAEAVEELPPAIEHDEYRRELLGRFQNPRIEHRLDQIAIDTTFKISVRIAPVAEARVVAGRRATACARVLAEWAAWSSAVEQRSGPSSTETHGAHGAHDSAVALTTLISRRLGSSAEFVDAVRLASAVVSGGGALSGGGWA